MSKYLSAVLISVILLGFVAIRWTQPGWVDTIREAGFDQLIQMHPRETPENSPFALIAIDEETLERQGQWPWPRNEMANLVDQAFEAGVAMLVFDINFAQFDRFDLEGVNKVLNTPVTQSDMIETDDILAAAFRGRPIVLSSFRKTQSLGGQSEPAGTEVSPNFPPGYFGIGEDPVGLVANIDDFLNPIQKLADASQTIGSVVVGADQGGKIRRVPLVVSAGDDQYSELRFFLGLEAIRVATGSKQYTLLSHQNARHTFREFRGMYAIELSDRKIPVNADGSIRIFESVEMGATVVSGADVVEGRDLDRLAGKIAFVGLRTVGLGDRATGALGQLRRGVDFQVLVAEQLLAQHYLQEPRFSRFIEIAVMCLLVGLICLLIEFSRLSMGIRFVLAFGVTTLPLLASYLIFKNAIFASNNFGPANIRLLIDGILPSVLCLITLVLGFGNQALRTELQKRRLRTSFARYVSPNVVDQISHLNAESVLRPRDVELSVLFADIRGFTSLSETLNAAQSTTLVNLFLAEMSAAVLENNGTIDKFLGDGLMAFWNAPFEDSNHCQNATAAGIEIVHRIAQLNERLLNDPTWGEIIKDHPLRVGIGINTGPASVGNFGSDQRVDYSCIGDTVNTAARIEGLCKEHGATVLISAGTHAGLMGLEGRPLVDIPIRGRANLVTLFDVSPRLT